MRAEDAELPLTLMGCRVRLVSPEAMPPVLQISPNFPHVSPEFRASWNRWALERFGRKNSVLFLQFGGLKYACMTEETARSIRAGLDRLGHDLVEGRNYQLGELRRGIRGLINPQSVVSAKDIT